MKLLAQIICTPGLKNVLLFWCPCVVTAVSVQYFSPYSQCSHLPGKYVLTIFPLNEGGCSEGLDAFKLRYLYLFVHNSTVASFIANRPSSTVSILCIHRSLSSHHNEV